MRELLKELHFYEHLLQPGVIISHRDTFCCEFAQKYSIDAMLDEQDDPTAAPAELPLHDKEAIEIIGIKAGGRYVWIALRR